MVATGIDQSGSIRAASPSVPGGSSLLDFEWRRSGYRGWSGHQTSNIAAPQSFTVPVETRPKFPTFSQG